MLIYPAAVQITFIYLAVIAIIHVNFMSTRQPDNTSLSLTLKSFLFSDSKSENKKGFSTSEKARITSQVNTCYLYGRRGNSHFTYTN